MATRVGLVVSVVAGLLLIAAVACGDGSQVVIVSHSFPDSGGYLSEGQYEVTVDVQLPGIGKAELWLQTLNAECTSGINVDQAPVSPGNSSHSLTWTVTASDLQKLRRVGEVCVEVTVVEREVPGIEGQTHLAQAKIGSCSC